MTCLLELSSFSSARSSEECVIVALLSPTGLKRKAVPFAPPTFDTLYFAPPAAVAPISKMTLLASLADTLKPDTFVTTDVVPSSLFDAVRVQLARSESPVVCDPYTTVTAPVGNCTIEPFVMFIALSSTNAKCAPFFVLIDG